MVIAKWNKSFFYLRYLFLYYLDAVGWPPVGPGDVYTIVDARYTRACINARVRCVWCQWSTVNNRHRVYPRLPATLGGQVGVGHGSQDYPVRGILCLRDILFKWTPRPSSIVPSAKHENVSRENSPSAAAGHCCLVSIILFLIRRCPIDIN